MREDDKEELVYVCVVIFIYTQEKETAKEKREFW